MARIELDVPLHEEARHALEHHDNAGGELWISRPQSYSRPIASATLSDDVRRLESRFRRNQGRRWRTLHIFGAFE